MKTLNQWSLAGFCTLFITSIILAAPVGTKITYQGRLDDSGSPANGNYDFVFALFDNISGGNQVASSISKINIPIVDGNFTTTLDFGTSAFNGEARWLQIGVRPSGGGSFTSLTPRQELTPTPYAIRAQTINELPPGMAVNGSGTANYIPKFSDADTLTNSNILLDGTNLAVNTDSSDGHKLNVKSYSTGHAAIRGIEQSSSAIYSEGLLAVLNPDPELDGNPYNVGVLGIKHDAGADGTAVYGWNNDSGTENPAMYAVSDGKGTTNYGIYASAKNAETNWAGYFNGDVFINSTLKIDNITALQAFDGDALVARLGRNGSGGHFQLYDNENADFLYAFPDSAGTGGYFSIRRNSNSWGFIVDGNYNTENPRVSILGQNRSMIFTPSEQGNASVALPNNAINSFEIENETGAASTNSSSYQTISSTGTNLLTRTINAPTAGYVLAIGSLQAQVYHINDSTTAANFGISTTSATLPTSQNFQLSISPSIPTATFNYPVTVNGIFSVSEGNTTFYLVGEETSGIVNSYNRQLSLIFIPTAYGVISVPASKSVDALTAEQTGLETPSSSLSITPEDIAIEQAQAQDLYIQRIESELAIIRTELDVLKADKFNNK